MRDLPAGRSLVDYGQRGLSTRPLIGHHLVVTTYRSRATDWLLGETATSDDRGLDADADHVEAMRDEQVSLAHVVVAFRVVGVRLDPASALATGVCDGSVQ